MKLKDVKSDLRKEKGMLYTGAVLLVLAAVLFLIVQRFGTVMSWVQVLFSALTPVFCGIIIAYILNVFVHFFEDFLFKPFSKSKSKLWSKAKRPLAILLAYLVVILFILFVTCFIIPGLVESLQVLAVTAQETVPVYVNNLVRQVTEFAQKNDLTFVQDFLKSFNWSSLFSNVTKVTTDFLSSLVSVTVNVASGVFTFVMGFIFSIYMLFGKEKLLRGVRSALLAYLPEKAAGRVSRVAAMANQVFFSFIRGQFLECVILGSLCYIGMSILGLDYALLISSIVALGALIPILGAYIGCISGVIVLLLVHPLDALIFLIFLLCLQQLEGNLIYPRVVGSSIGLPPVWTLFAVLFWGSVLGISGILIGTPTTAVIYRLFRSSVYERLRAKEIDPQAPCPSGAASAESGENGQKPENE